MKRAETLNAEKTVDHIHRFIHACLKQSGYQSLVLGLSGGVDSALTAMICRNILPKDQVNCLFMPEKATPEIDRDHVELLVRQGDLNYRKRDISDLTAAFSEAAVISPDKISLGNVKARLRMVLLYEYANTTRSLVCGTSNKSELMIGYFTKYGDGGVDLMPIGHLYKTQVWELATFLNLPKSIIEKKPSAGLFKGQTDEGELKITYRVLDRILSGLELNRTDAAIAESSGATFEDVARIRKMVALSEHKRRTAPFPQDTFPSPLNGDKR